MESTEKKVKPSPERMSLISRILISYALANLDDVNDVFSEEDDIPEGSIKVDDQIVPKITGDEAEAMLEVHNNLYQLTVKFFNEPHTITVEINKQETEVDGTSRADVLRNLKAKILEIQKHPGFEQLVITRGYQETATFTQGDGIDVTNDPDMAATYDKMAWYVEYMDNGTGELGKCNNFEEGLSEMIKYAEGPGDHWA